MTVFVLELNDGLMLAENGGTTRDVYEAWMAESLEDAQRMFDYKKQKNDALSEIKPVFVEF